MTLRPALPAALAVALALAACSSAPPSVAREDRTEALAGFRAAPPDSPEGLVARLVDGGFAERSAAADRLVAMGDRALPALGTAGEARATPYAGVSVPATRPVIEAILAREPAEAVAGRHLASPYAAVRVAAAEEAGRRGSIAAAEPLSALLSDDDVEVRRAAIGALRRLTGRFEDVDASAPAGLRAQAVRAWREESRREGRLAPPVPAAR
jgi:hypothetical protein